MRPEPDSENYQEMWHQHYADLNYGKGLAAWFMKQSHKWSEERYSEGNHFPIVLEVGAGTGIHIQHVRHSFDKYIVSDVDDRHLKQVIFDNQKNGEIIVAKENATNLSYPENSVDRLIAAHVLEHLPNPHLVLREWYRVLKHGAIMTLVLPCDPGLAWRVGRNFGPRAKDEKLGIPYDYWMAREHINSITNLGSLIRYYFEELEENWRPFFIPGSDLNLFYICHITIAKNLN